MAATDNSLPIDIIDKCEMLVLLVRLILRVEGGRVRVAGGIFTNLEQVMLYVMLMIFKRSLLLIHLFFLPL